MTYDQIQFDKDGHLLFLNDWNETIASQLAVNENLILTADHWQVINYLRHFYLEFQHTPAMRVLVKALTQTMGKERGNSIYLQRLFPDGLLRQASKIAGLPKPPKCL